MAYIQPNKLLPPTARVIRPFQCSMIATEGPNILGKLNMSGVEIPYYSQFTTRMILNPSATKQPLLYGFLGTEVTFVLLKFTYDETNPACQIEEEQYIEYYFADQPSIIRTAGKLLLLTGNSTHRIPQIFLNNPSEVKVYVDAMVANLEQSDINIDDVSNVTVGNLYYNSIISDKVDGHCTDITGSTQLQVIGVDGYVQLYLDYIDILTIEPRYETYEIKITTESDTTVILGFLSIFEMYQALSRISWVTESPTTRYLTKDYPGLDVLPPDVGLQPYLPDPIPNPFPYPFTSGTTILPREIVEYFVSGVTDNRDGEISVDSVFITIRQQGFVEPITGITHVGVYDITMSVSDLANNQKVLSYTIVCDDTPPTIFFKAPTAVGTGFTMTETDMALSNVGITAVDIINKSVDYVYDTIDGLVDKYNIIVFVVDPISGFTPMTTITTPGSYELTYYVEDLSGNAFTTGKTMTYEGYKILEAGEAFTVPSSATSVEFLYGGNTGTTATVILSGVSFVVASVSGSSNVEFVWDFGGPDEHNFGSGNTGTLDIVVLGTMFTIGFTRGSIFFSITNEGPQPEYSSVTPIGLTYTYQSGTTDYITIDTNVNWTIDSFPFEMIDFSSFSGNTSEVIIGTMLSENLTGSPITGMTTIIVSGTTLYETYNILITQERRPSYFGVTPTAITFTYESGLTNMIDVDTNIEWNVTNSPSWSEISVLSGTGSETLIVTTTEENLTLFPRTDLVTINALGIDYHVSITQEPVATPFLEVSPSALTFTYGSGVSNTFDISSNYDWTISDSISWVEINISGGTGNDTINVTTKSSNTSGYPRTGITTITSNENTYDVLMTQNSEPFSFNVVGVSGFTIPIVMMFTPYIESNFDVEWGDGTSSHISGFVDYRIDSGTTTSHVYSSIGDYTINITGFFDMFGFAESTIKIPDSIKDICEVYKKSIVKINSWGNIGCRYFSFEESENLVELPNTPIPSSITSVSLTFSGCTSLTSLPSNIFSGCTNITSVSHCFSYCTNLLSIPEHLFDDCVNITYAAGIFRNCTNLSNIPNDLFRNNTKIYNFRQLFENCTSLTIDGGFSENFFGNNTGITYIDEAFENCSSLNGNALDFIKNPNVHPTTYNYCFRNSTNLNDYNYIPTSWGGSSNYLTVSPSNIIAGGNSGESYTFNISTFVDWTIDVSVDWIEVSSTGGTGNTNVTLLITESNPDQSIRYGYITVSVFEDSSIISVSQGFSSHFGVSPSALTFTYESGIFNTLEIDTNSNWQIIDKPSWVDLDKISGTTSDTVVVTTNSINNLGVIRSGLTSISYYNGQRDIVTTQDFEPIPPIVDNPFILEMNIPVDNYTITLPTDNLAYNYNYQVSWGDGSSINHVTSYTDTGKTHTYSTSGIYLISISGVCDYFCFTNMGITKNSVTRIISWGNIGLKYLDLHGCSNLTSIPIDIYNGLSLIDRFDFTFQECTSLTSIPSGLFDNCPNVSQFYGTFSNCTSLTSIPSGLFDYNTKVRWFSSTFAGCTLTSIPSGLFDNCPDVISFSRVFESCTSLISIPPNLFDFNTGITTFHGTFWGCRSLTSIPNGIFDNCTRVTDFTNTFCICISLTDNAPELWLTHFIATGTNCFTNDIGLDNYMSIPASWGGGGA